MEHPRQECPDGLKPTWTPPRPVLTDDNLVFAIRVEAPVPSLNELLSANPWRRKSLKKAIQHAFGSALNPSGNDFWMKTTYVKSTGLIASDMRESFHKTLQGLRESRLSSVKLARAKRRQLMSESGKSGKPPSSRSQNKA